MFSKIDVSFLRENLIKKWDHPKQSVWLLHCKPESFDVHTTIWNRIVAHSLLPLRTNTYKLISIALLFPRLMYICQRRIYHCIENNVLVQIACVQCFFSGAYKREEAFCFSLKSLSPFSSHDGNIKEGKSAVKPFFFVRSRFAVVVVFDPRILRKVHKMFALFAFMVGPVQLSMLHLFNTPLFVPFRCSCVCTLIKSQLSHIFNPVNFE